MYNDVVSIKVGGKGFESRQLGDGELVQRSHNNRRTFSST